VGCAGDVPAASVAVMAGLADISKRIARNALIKYMNMMYKWLGPGLAMFWPRSDQF
jgi:hypothetical protein